VGSVREIEFRRRQLIAAFSRAQALGNTEGSEELQADYAKYLCVRVCGFVERAVADVIMAYAQDKTPVPLRSYLESSLRRLRLVDKERLLQVVGTLDTRWRAELDSDVVDERQAAINSIVGLRNDIAHGGSSSVGLAQMVRYWAAAQEVVEKMEEVILGRRKPMPRK
jgi:hypothetical protein